MRVQRNYRRGRYSVTRLVVHLVFTTKYDLEHSAALCSRSYFACSAGGATLETLKAYVNGQKTPD
ncbi:hypothetical protein NONS58_20270 [Nitrosococcus oceani]|nr:hypothetical protein [Nitrosococcus oceani]GEM20608.1 hypothetical protein NONS58_20270 [Nitrosococcus oceani]